MRPAPTATTEVVEPRPGRLRVWLGRVWYAATLGATTGLLLLVAYAWHASSTAADRWDLVYYPPCFYPAHDHPQPPIGAHGQSLCVGNYGDSVCVTYFRNYMDSIPSRESPYLWHDQREPGAWEDGWITHDRLSTTARHGFHLIEGHRGDQADGYFAYGIGLPHWVLAIVAGIVPGLRAFRFARRVRRGRCVRCGYDLRATPLRCPECGTVPRRVARRAERSTVR